MSERREIKFRVWSRKYKQFWFFELGQPFEWKRSEHPDQFTGLKDKNGKGIYEGDVVEITHPMEGKSCGVIRFESCKGRFVWDDKTGNYGLTTDDKANKVVGNIYENPGLLGGTSENPELLK